MQAASFSKDAGGGDSSRECEGADGCVVVCQRGGMYSMCRREDGGGVVAVVGTVTTMFRRISLTTQRSRPEKQVAGSLGTGVCSTTEQTVAKTRAIRLMVGQCRRRRCSEVDRLTKVYGEATNTTA
jgi:hypothetical protein